jgi:hypothetical protein
VNGDRSYRRDCRRQAPRWRPLGYERADPGSVTLLANEIGLLVPDEFRGRVAQLRRCPVALGGQVGGVTATTDQPAAIPMAGKIILATGVDSHWPGRAG